MGALRTFSAFAAILLILYLVIDAEVMTSMCARLYGQHSARRRADRALAAARKG